jgi:WD40 repeat protein
VLKSKATADDVRKYPDAIKFILHTCNGWPLPLAMCGTMVKETGFRWRLVDEKLRANLLDVEVSCGAIEHAGLRAVLQANLEMACCLTSTDPLLLATFGSKSASENFLRQTDFDGMYMRLSILDASRSIPDYALGAVFDVKDAQADVIAQIFAKAGLARLHTTCAGGAGESGSGHDVLMLHDLQHAFAESLCVKAGSSVSDQHARVLRSIAKRFCGDGDALDPGFDWSTLCEHRDCGKGKETSATYMCDELVRHVLGSTSDDRQGGSRISRILGLMCSYKWIRARGVAFDRPTVLRDFATTVAGLSVVEAGVESGTVREESCNATRFCGEVRALGTIAEVLQRISPRWFGKERPCSLHGNHDSGLAAELYGRLAVLKFERLDAAAQRVALNVVLKLRASIQDSARPPWLLPRFECYGSVQRKDARCIYELLASEGEVRGLAYTRRGGVDVLLSGGSDGTLRLHDVGASRRQLPAMSGHDKVVSGVCVADKCSVGAARSTTIASCSLDGSVRLWGVEEAGRGDEKCPLVLRCSSRARLWCVAITPDAQRVVAGGYGPRDSGAAPDDAKSDRSEHRVHVWTRRVAATCSSVTADAIDYVTVALAGHTDWVRAVQVSRDGQRVVSGSDDGTVRVWSVPPRAALAAADVGPPLVLELRFAMWGHVDDKVWALSLAADAAAAFVGMSRGSIHVVDCDSLRLFLSLRTDRTAGAAVTCLALVEFTSNSMQPGGSVCGRLFAGHVNGLVSEWDLGIGSCLTVYGDTRSGTAVEKAIAAWIVPAAGGQGVEGDGKSAAAGSAVGSSGGGSSVGVGGSECVIQFATGHENGTARVWHADSGEAESDEEKTDLSAGLLVTEYPAAGCMSVPKRHVDILQDPPSCMSASADGRWLVSGSYEAIVCVWDGYSGRCTTTLLGHETGNIRCVDISPCGSIVASCSEDTTARIWKLKDRTWSRPIVLQHETQVNCIMLTADSSRAITGDAEGVLRVWNVETGMQCEPVLSRHTAGRLSLGTKCRIVRNADSGWRGCEESLDLGARSLERSVPPSLQPNLWFSSRDKNGTSQLWNWPSENPINMCEVTSKQLLQHLFPGERDVTEIIYWREKRCWRKGKPDTFTLHAATEASSPGCVVGRGRAENRELEVLPFAAPPQWCNCAARVELESCVLLWTMHAFERFEGGLLRTIVCCGLNDGTVAVFELVRSPE